MASVSKFKRTYTASFITGTGIILMTLYYIFYYIPQKEERINARYYRVLQRISNNLANDIAHYQDYMVPNYISQLQKQGNVRPDAAAKPIEASPTSPENATTPPFRPMPPVHASGLRPVTDCNQKHLHFNASDKTLHLSDNKAASATDALYHASIAPDSILLPLMRWDSFSSFMVLQRPAGNSASEEHRLIFVTSDGEKTKATILVPKDTLSKLAAKSAWQKPVSMNIAGVPHRIFVVTQEVGPQQEWVLFGAVDNEKYDTERKAVSTHTLTFVSLTFAILFLGFPFLKILLMSRQERLHKRDVAISVAAIFSGIALVAILLIDGYAYYGPDREKERRMLENLNSTLQQNFVMEIRGLVSQLKRLDSLSNSRASRSDTPENRYHYTKLSQGPVSPTECQAGAPEDKSQQEIRMGGNKAGTCYRLTGFNDSNVPIPLTVTDTPFELPNLVRIFWGDSAGNMVQVWTTREKTDIAESIQERQYFRAIQNGAGWHLPDQADEFFLQSVSSLIYGGKYAVLSTKSNWQTANPDRKPIMVALTTKLATLHQSVLPPGYGYGIIDDKGEVLFHQFENLQLNENLLEETDGDPVLATALKARVPAHIVQDYQGGRQSLYVSPLEQLPLYMVTYVDHEIRREMNVYVILQTIVSFLLYSFILLVLISLVVYGKKRLSKLSFNWLGFRWLWPEPSKSASYIKCSAAIILTTVVMISLANVNYPVGLFFLCLYAATYVFIFCYITLHAVPLRLLININGKSFYASRLRHFLISSFFVVLFLNAMCAIASSTAFQHGLLFQLLVLGGYGLLYFAQVYLLKRYRSKQKNKSKAHTLQQIQGWLRRRYRHSYVWMLASLLFITSALPAYFMFQVAYNLEAARRIMLSQLHLANGLEESENTPTSHPTNTLTAAKRINSYMSFYQNTTYKKHHIMTLTDDQANDAAPQGPRDISTVALGYKLPATQANHSESGAQIVNSILNLSFWLLGPSKSNLLLTRGCQSPPCVESLWSSLNSNNLKFYSPRLNTPDSDSVVVLTSDLPKFTKPPLLHKSGQWPRNINKSGVLFWVDFLLLAVLLFYFLLFLVNRIFNLELLHNIRMRQIDYALLQHVSKNRLFMVALPGAPSIREAVKRQENRTNCKVRFITYDLAKGHILSQESMQYLKRTSKKALVVHIRHFEFRPLAEDSLEQKVRLLQQLQQLKRGKIILESAVHPSFWEERLKDASSPAGKSEELIQQLLPLLGSFTKIYNSFQATSPISHSKLQQMSKKELLIQFVKKECLSLPNLKQLRQELYTYIHHNFHKKGIEREDLIYRIQSLAQLYYRRLWATCSEEEKYFLYDLAQDGLVNARNMGVLSSLLGKGLLVRERDMRLKIMNESFKNFVLTVVDPAEALRYEKKVSREGTWHTYKTPFLLIIIGIGLFIFFTQKQAWLNIVAIGTAVTTIMTLLPRLSIFLPAFLLSKDTK